MASGSVVVSVSSGVATLPVATFLFWILGLRRRRKPRILDACRGATVCSVAVAFAVWWLYGESIDRKIWLAEANARFGKRLAEKKIAEARKQIEQVGKKVEKVRQGIQDEVDSCAKKGTNVVRGGATVAAANAAPRLLIGQTATTLTGQVVVREGVKAGAKSASNVAFQQAAVQAGYKTTEMAAREVVKGTAKRIPGKAMQTAATTGATTGTTSVLGAVAGPAGLAAGVGELVGEHIIGANISANEETKKACGFIGSVGSATAAGGVFGGPPGLAVGAVVGAGSWLLSRAIDLGMNKEK